MNIFIDRFAHNARMTVRHVETTSATKSLVIRVANQLRRKPRALVVRPEFAAFLEQSMSERPDLWADLANSPTPMKSSSLTNE
jgi:hypothetical protein